MQRSCIALGLLLTCMFPIVTGCGPGGPEIADVHGKITMDGEPLANAMVMFVPQGGRPAAANTDENGEYRLNFSSDRQGAIPGPNTVRISTLSDPYEDVDGNPVPARPETIPAEYNQYSKLKFEVVADTENIANFDLKSGGKVISNSDYGDE